MFIPFNDQLLLDLVDQPVEKLNDLCPGVSLKDFLMYRMMAIEDGKFILTQIGQNMIDFEGKRRKSIIEEKQDSV